MFLTDEQLVILTGRKRRRDQIAWLTERDVTPESRTGGVDG